MPKKSADGSTAPNGAKSVSLTFSTPDELNAYAALFQAADDDDRSVSSFIVRVLIGKERSPLAPAAD